MLHFIEHYQKQPDIRDLKNPSAENKFVTVASRLPFHNSPAETPLHFYAESPKDLSRHITEVVEAMSVHGKLPPLWFRGQRNEHPSTLPGMFRDGSDFALARLQQALRLARAQILPYGIEFEKPQWLTYLQHNEFETNILDFSESFYPSLYFAIQHWIDEPSKLPEYDSHISVLNPVLFNLAMRALDCRDHDSEEQKKLIEYLANGTLKDGVYLELPLFANGESYEGPYASYFSWDMEEPPEKQQRPIAVLTPKNSERMKKQTGQFIFYDLFCDGQGRKKSIEALHGEYYNLLQKLNLPYIPFLCEININRYAYQEFIQYVRAIGLRKYHVYPETDKLAKDITQILQN